MKNVPVLLLVAFCGIISLSCISSPKETQPAIDPASLVGTKWFSNMVFLGFRNTLEIVDETNCIYTSVTGSDNHTYTVKGNKFILKGSGTYEIRENVMYYKGNPYWIIEEYFNSLTSPPETTDASLPE